jgi:hypothetical protein
MKKTSARGSAKGRAGKPVDMKIIVEVNVKWNGEIDETEMERIVDAFHSREDTGAIYDVTVGGSAAERWLDISFGMNAEKKSIEDLVPIVEEIIEEALSPDVTSDVPPAHIIDAMSFKPVLIQHG